VRILGLDTATRATTVALCDIAAPGPGAPGLASGGLDLPPGGFGLEPGGLDLEGRDDPPAGRRPAHATRLMGLVVGLLEEAGIGWDAVDRIAVGLGPGTFTGLRIGVATARALAHARQIPLVGVSTLASLALGGLRAADGFPQIDTVFAVIDARRSEVFAAAWPALGPGPAPGAETSGAMAAQVMAPEALARVIAGDGLGALAIGDGAIEFRSILESSGALVPEDGSGLHRVTARSHCSLAGRLSPSAAEDIRPEYLRLPDAEIARRAAGSQ
jgi:tRNA threonylcarbamoyladenosine biosynthesis protein TsaB